MNIRISKKRVIFCSFSLDLLIPTIHKKSEKIAILIGAGEGGGTEMSIMGFSVVFSFLCIRNTYTSAFATAFKEIGRTKRNY